MPDLAPPLIDLRPFKQTMPVGRPGHPDEIYPVSHWPWFEPQSVIFRAHAGGVTTPGSRYPRSELRELREWDSRQGMHQLLAGLAVTHLPRVKPHVVVAQIHNGSDDVVQVRLEGRRLFVESNGDEMGDLDPIYALSTRFYLRLVADHSGIRVRHQRSGSTNVVERRIKRVGSGWYFKAGCYLQTNVSKGDAADDYAEVRLDRLQVKHS